MTTFSYQLTFNDTEFIILEKALNAFIKCKDSRAFDVAVATEILSRLHVNAFQTSGNNLGAKDGPPKITIGLFDENHD